MQEYARKTNTTLKRMYQGCAMDVPLRIKNLNNFYSK